MPTPATYSILQKKENAHNDPIYCCAWTKTNTTGDSKANLTDFIVSGGLDSLIKVWKLEHNKLELLHTLEGHCMAVVSVAVSPDGYTLASSSLDSTLIIWDMLSGQRVHEVQTGTTDVWKVAFSPDGSQVVSSSHTGKLIVYNVEKGQMDNVLDTRGKFALSVAWSANGKYIAAGEVNGVVCIFDLSMGKLLHTIEAHTDSVRSITFTPKSHSIVSASNDGKVKVFDVASAGLQGTLSHDTWVVAVAISPDGLRVATASADGKVRIVMLDGLQVLHIFKEHSDTVWGVQFNAEGNKLLSISKDKNINIYECPIVTKPKDTVKGDILIK